MDLSTGINVSASANGGADVDMKLVLFVNKEVPNDDCIQLLKDLHEGSRRCVLGPAKKGDAVLTILLAVAPLVDGQFDLEITLTHPDFEDGSRTVSLSGDVGADAKSIRRNIALG